MYTVQDEDSAIITTSLFSHLYVRFDILVTCEKTSMIASFH